MKHFIILTLIAAALFAQGTIEDPLIIFEPITFEWDTTLHYVALTSAEVARLDSARLVHYAWVQEEYDFDWADVYGTVMEHWFHDTFDSLQACGKSWEYYDWYLYFLLRHHQQENNRVGILAIPEHQSDFEISIGGCRRFFWRVLGFHSFYTYPYGKD